jgi:hypothetical protein
MLNQIQHEQEHSTKLALYQQSPLLSPESTAVPPHELTRDEMVALQKRLVNKNKAVSAEAEGQLAMMDSAALTAFIAFERQNRRRRIKSASISLIVLYCTLIAISIFTKQSHLFGMFGAFTGVMAGAAAFSRSYKSGVVALTRLENTDSVGELVSALEIQDREVQQIVRPALIRMLPKLRASDAKLLDDSSKQTLRRFLKGKFSGRTVSTGAYETDALLRIAILDALKQIGDSSFIEIVKDIANGDGHQVDRMAKEIAAAARECLPYLEQRTLEAAASSELVRASSANSVGSADTLLRPVTGTQEMHETELLRAAEEEYS